MAKKKPLGKKPRRMSAAAKGAIAGGIIGLGAMDGFTTEAANRYAGAERIRANVKGWHPHSPKTKAALEEAKSLDRKGNSFKVLAFSSAPVGAGAGAAAGALRGRRRKRRNLRGKQNRG